MVKHVLVAATGSVAAIKIPDLVQKLVDYSDLKVPYIATCNNVEKFRTVTYFVR